MAWSDILEYSEVGNFLVAEKLDVVPEPIKAGLGEVIGAIRSSVSDQRSVDRNSSHVREIVETLVPVIQFERLEISSEINAITGHIRFDSQDDYATYIS